MQTSLRGSNVMWECRELEKRLGGTFILDGAEKEWLCGWHQVAKSVAGRMGQCERQGEHFPGREIMELRGSTWFNTQRSRPHAILLPPPTTDTPPMRCHEPGPRTPRRRSHSQQQHQRQQPSRLLTPLSRHTRSSASSAHSGSHHRVSPSPSVDRGRLPEPLQNGPSTGHYERHVRRPGPDPCWDCLPASLKWSKCRKRVETAFVYTGLKCGIQCTAP